MASAAGLTRDRAADFFCKSTYLRGCGGHTGVFDDAKPQRHRLRQCNTVADPGRRDRGTGAGMRNSPTAIEAILKTEAPCLSTRVCDVLQREGLTPAAARQRVSRVGGAVQRLP